MEKTISELEKSILDAKTAYYNGIPIMSDASFDLLIRTLREIDPNNSVLTQIGTPVVDGNKIKLDYKMLSTEKTLTLDAMDKYWRRVDPVITASDLFVGSQKIDGLSINLTYENGNLVKASTSGDGLIGSEKTSRVSLIPDVLETLNSEWSGQISGECFMTGF